MNRAGGLFVQQTKAILENRWQALFCVAILTLMPYTTWLAGVLVALITLRKGEIEGGQALIVAMSIHFIVMMIFVSPELTVYSSIGEFLPLFIAASTLRRVGDWRLTFSVLIAQGLLLLGLMMTLYPSLAEMIYQQIQFYMTQTYDPAEVAQILKLTSKFDGKQIYLALHVCGLTAMSFAAMLFARYLQAKCYNPGGFKKEITAFRSGRLALSLLLLVMLANYNHLSFARNLLPFFLLYFITSGFVFAYVVVEKQKLTGIIALLLVTLLVSPMVMLFVFIIFGSLDSLFNFREHLLAKARKTV